MLDYGGSTSLNNCPRPKTMGENPECGKWEMRICSACAFRDNRLARGTLIAPLFGAGRWTFAPVGNLVTPDPR